MPVPESAAGWPHLWMTLRTAGLAIGLCAPVGVFLGYLHARRAYRGRALAEAFLVLPLAVPPTLMAFALFPAPAGAVPLEHYRERLLDPVVAVLVAAAAALPMVLLSAKAAFAAVDGGYERMARTLGAGPLRTFWRVTLPLAAPTLTAGIAFAFARAVGEFGVIMTVAGALTFGGPFGSPNP